MARAQCWPGPSWSDSARWMAGWQSEKTICLCPDCPRFSKILKAWRIAQTSNALWFHGLLLLLLERS